MFITEKKVHGCKIVELNGRVDATAETFEADLKDMLVNESKIIIDCEKLNYINSSGLRIFLSIFKDVTKENSRIIICNLDENIIDLFKISGFFDLFEICNNRNEALELIELKSS
jgi:anti-anti-sigma factor